MLWLHGLDEDMGAAAISMCGALLESLNARRLLVLSVQLQQLVAAAREGCRGRGTCVTLLESRHTSAVTAVAEAASCLSGEQFAATALPPMPLLGSLSAAKAAILQVLHHVHTQHRMLGSSVLGRLWVEEDSATAGMPSLLWLLHLASWLEPTMRAAHAAAPALDGKDQTNFMPQLLLQLELLPVRLAQWLAVVAPETAGDEREQLIGDLAAGMAGAGGDAWGCVDRVRSNFKAHSVLSTFSDTYERAVQEAMRSGDGEQGAMVQLMGCSQFGALWAWSRDACGRLVGALQAACGFDPTQAAQACSDQGGSGRSGPRDLVGTVEAIRLAAETCDV